MRFSKIKDNDIANSIGVCMSLWTQGCPHKCEGCFNEDTWDFSKGKEFTEENLKYIIENINKNSIERNLSILGGEPLCPPNVKGVIEVCKTVKNVFSRKEIYLWTGYTIEEFDEIQSEILDYIDILVDGKFEKSKRNLLLDLRGSENQRVIDVKKTIKSGEITIFDRKNRL